MPLEDRPLVTAELHRVRLRSAAIGGIAVTARCVATRPSASFDSARRTGAVRGVGIIREPFGPSVRGVDVSSREVHVDEKREEPARA